MNKKLIGIISIAVALSVMCTGALFAASVDSGLRVQYVNKAITLDSDDLFSAAKPLDVKLIAMEVTNPLGPGSIPKDDIKTLQSNARYVFNMSKNAPNLSVKAIHNGKTIAFQLIWDDSAADIEGAVDTFRDSVSLMFPLSQTGSLTPSPLMGSKGEAVNVWQWRADWQAEKDGIRHLEARQPQVEGVHVGLSDSILKAQYPGKPTPDATMVEYISEGFGTLTRQSQQNAMAMGKHQGGKWKVVFLRDLKDQDASDAVFVPGKRSYVNFAVWNGGERDFDGMKSISIVWTPLMLDSAK
ncbi:MAG: hypothetical protein HQL06_02085 [Nitrospirae bacterium]|nr:hypothetical protein [Nitrospirota bacterium]